MTSPRAPYVEHAYNYDPQSRHNSENKAANIVTMSYTYKHKERTKQKGINHDALLKLVMSKHIRKGAIVHLDSAMWEGDTYVSGTTTYRHMPERDTDIASSWGAGRFGPCAISYCQARIEGVIMFHEYAPLAAFIGLILVIAGSAAFGRKPSLLSLALVAIGVALNVTPYL